MPLTQVTNTMIADSAVTAGKVATDAVETPKIKDANVTQPKLGSGVAGTGPAFSAYIGNAQAIGAAADTKLQFNTENFDTNNCFDRTTNFRFTPNVAGYYEINLAAQIGATAQGYVILYKNGAQIGRAHV